ncbi:hypothetical protein U9M48_024991 [Paspalum notatum var. saurae]|uniref:Protein FAR1-RELATED SEQUENCE n=1 Tax=Paspalum notatum var. saurae TaxID=547442 RepID=A0AAQ3TSM2_PASNO
MYNLSRVFKGDISAVLTVKSSLDPHRLEFSKKMAHDDNGDDSGDDYNGGSYDNELPYTERDTKNLRQEYRAEYRRKDVKATLEYFEELNKEHPEFYYSYSLDEFDRVENIFWVDGEAKKDLAMEAAIAEVFRETVHRNCRWHVLENARKVLGPFLINKKDIASDFNDCVNKSFTTHEFEHKWQLMLDKHEIRDDERFRHLYDTRHRWVTAYFMLRFFPFLQTTVRSEGFNAVLKKYVNPQNSILNFLHQYKQVQQRIFSKQLENESATVVKVHHYLTEHPMEVQMKEAYTRKLFNVFQNELQLSSSYYVVRVQGDELIDVVPYRTCPDKLYGSRIV